MPLKHFIIIPNIKKFLKVLKENEKLKIRFWLFLTIPFPNKTLTGADTRRIAMQVMETGVLSWPS